MTIRSEERRPIPADTFRLRLVIARLHAGHKTAESAAQAIGVSGQTWLNWERGIHTDSAMRPMQLHWIAEKMDVDEDWLRNGGPLTEMPAPEPPNGSGATRELRGPAIDHSACLIDHSDDALTRLIAASWQDPLAA